MSAASSVFDLFFFFPLSVNCLQFLLQNYILPITWFFQASISCDCSFNFLSCLGKVCVFASFSLLGIIVIAPLVDKLKSFVNYFLFAVLLLTLFYQCSLFLDFTSHYLYFCGFWAICIASDFVNNRALQLFHFKNSP